MERKKKALFRCDAGDHIGGGHLIRCLTFAKALHTEGFECSFLCNDQAWDFPALISSGFAKLEQGDLEDSFFDTIIVDHYGLAAAYEKTLRPYCDKILVIDDLADRAHECDILLDASPSRKVEDYAALVPEHCQLCVGIDYFLLREEFLQHQRPAELHNNPKKIFVTMGSIDGAELLPTVMAFLESYAAPLEINVMMTFRTKTLERVKALADSSKHDVRLNIDIPNPFETMSQSDLAITAGGMTCLELVALNVPTWAIIVADNQRENVGYLSERGYIKHIANPENMDELDLAQWLDEPDYKRLATGQKLKIIEHML